MKLWGENLDLPVVLERCVQEDSQAWSLLMDAYLPYIGRLSGRLANDMGLGDDLVSEVYLILRRRLHTFRRDPEAIQYRFQSWLTIVIKTTWRGMMRGQFRYIWRDEVLLEDTEVMEGPEGRWDRLTGKDVLDAMTRCPDKEYQCLRQNIVEGRPASEIAGRTGMTLMAVNGNIQRGKRRVRKLLAS